MSPLVRRGRAVRCAILSVGLCTALAGAADEFETGGPLMGVPLPAYRTRHGEPPGYPGCLPEADGTATSVGDQFPEPELHEGAVEHWRTYWQKYLPVKSFFDRQSQVRNFLAADLGPATEDYAEPVYRVGRGKSGRDTGLRNPPVKVVRLGPGGALAALDLGELPEGMYALRVIAAVETGRLERFRRPLVLRLTIDDGPAGEAGDYRLRCGYVDEFYSIAEFHFHAPTRRRYRATIASTAQSQVDVLVHNVSLDDVLAGADRRAIKTRQTLAQPPAEPRPATLDAAARAARDELLWGSLPPLNAQFGMIYGMGGDDPEANWPRLGWEGRDMPALAAAHGEWKDPHRDGIGTELLVNDKSKATYTLADLAAHRPLPDPYPVKDDGTGAWTPAAAGEEKPWNFVVVADAVRTRARSYVAEAEKRAKAWRTTGDRDAGRDAALMIVRLAHDFPAADFANALSSVLVQPGAYGRELRCRQRETRNPLLDVEFLEHYDAVFPLIESDQGLADAVGRHVPWVRSPRDVVRLVDTYLVQHLAKCYLRYHCYWGNDPAKIVVPATVLGDGAVTGPWMEWLFSRTFVYPYAPCGLQDLLVTGNDRNGMGSIGSYYYAQVEEAASKGEVLERYIAAGGDRRYDLRDPRRYPKPLATTHWFLDSRTAGLYFPRIGDVTGADKAYGSYFDLVHPMAARGWRWSRDPRFAFVIRHYGGRQGWTDDEWAEIEAAAAGVRRAPWFDVRSRVLTNWAGYLESGTQHDDMRFRRSATVRVGSGEGHEHADLLDLQVHAHGYPATMDGGQRSGYSTPADQTTRVHNLVEIDGRSARGHAWVRALADHEGARYLAVQANPAQEGVRLNRRQVALLDVTEGSGSRPLGPAEMVPTAKLPAGVVSPDSYVFDVCRVSGGRVHTYCFHGPIEDELAVDVTGRTPRAELPEAERDYLSIFPRPEESFGADAPALVKATWRLTRGGTASAGARNAARPGFGTEQRMNPGIWDADSPRKFTTLHLAESKGARVLTGWAHCNARDYGFTNLFVQRRGDADADVVFPAIVEPHAGPPFIESVTAEAIPGNESDALRAVALRVTTANGHRDLCFADGRPERTRHVGDVAAAGEFAYVSRDGAGLRQAAVVGGTLLRTPEIELAPAAAVRSGTVTAVDYAERTMAIDAPWPRHGMAGSVFEVGLPAPAGSREDHLATYTLARVEPSAGGAVLHVTEGADFYSGRVKAVDEAAGTVTCNVGLPLRGRTADWVATNEAGTRRWRAEYLAGERSTGTYRFRLTGGPVTAADFGRDGGLRLWEYGVGDRVRQVTHAGLRRIGEGAYELVADVDLAVRMPGKRLEFSVDGSSWSEPPPVIRVADLSERGTARLRVRAGTD